MRIICLTQVYKVIMCINTSQYQAISSPSKIDRPMVQAEASGKTCFDIGEAQPIDAERAGWGEYEIFFEIQPKISFESLSYSPFIPLYLRGGN